MSGDAYQNTLRMMGGRTASRPTPKRSSNGRPVRPQTFKPYIPGAAESPDTLHNKWRRITPTARARGVSPQTLQTVFRMDRDRLKGGRQPWDTRETIKALLAAEAGEPVTEKEESKGFNPINLPGNIVGDVGGLVAGVVSAPFKMVLDRKYRDNIVDQYVTGDTNVFEFGGLGYGLKTARVLQDGGRDSPTWQNEMDLFEAVKTGDYSKVAATRPNLAARLQQIQADDPNANVVTKAMGAFVGEEILPGAYTIENISKGRRGWEELYAHPVSTTLDVLPFATAAAGRLGKAGKLAKELRATPSVRRMSDNMPSTDAAIPRPLRAQLTKTVENGQLVDNRFGELLTRLGETSGAQAYKQRLGRDSRTVTGRIPGQLAGEMQEAISAPAGSPAARWIDELGTGEPGFADNLRALHIYYTEDSPIPPERLTELTDLLTTRGPRTAQKKFTPEEDEFLTLFREVSADFERRTVPDMEEIVGRWADPTTDTAVTSDWTETPVGSGKSTPLSAYGPDFPQSGVLRKPKDLGEGEIDFVDAYPMPEQRIKIKEWLKPHESSIRFAGNIYAPEQAYKLWRHRQRQLKLGEQLVHDGFWKTLRERAAAAGDDGKRLVQLIDEGIEGRGGKVPPRSQKMVDQLAGSFADDLDAIGAEFFTKIADDLGPGGTIKNDWGFSKKTIGVLRQYINESKALRDADELNIPRKYQPRAAEAGLREVTKIAKTRLEESNAQAAATGGQIVNVGDTLAELAEVLETRRFTDMDGLMMGAGEIPEIVREAGKEWRKWEASGFDPPWLHQVPTGKSGGVTRPQVLAGKRGVSHGKEAKVEGLQPHMKNLAFGMTHAQTETLEQLANFRYMKWFSETYGKSTAELTARFRGRSDKTAWLKQAHNADPETFRRNGWVKFDKDAFQAFDQGGHWLSHLGDDVYVPKWAMEAMQRGIVKHGKLMGLTRDPVMQVYRTSVLTLSPRWQINNIVGLGIITGAYTPFAFKHLWQGRQLVKTGETTIKVGGKPVKIRLSDDLRSLAGDTLRGQERVRYETGMVLGRMLREAAAEPGGGKWAEMMLGASEAGGKVVDVSAGFNNMVDGMGRSAAYLSGVKKHLKKSGDEFVTDEAHQAGMYLAERILPAYDAATPFEQSIMRNIMPFYAWYAHILRWSFNLALDHPFRVNLIMRAQQMVEDQTSDEWDPMFKNLIALGDSSKPGDQSAISFAGADPFKDLGQSLTLPGVIRGLNPIIQTGVGSVGIGRSGQADVFGETQIDPVTGRTAPETGSVLSRFTKSVVPQFESAGLILGVFDEHNLEYKGDRGAYWDRVFNGLGVPANMYQNDFNVQEHAVRREIQLHRQMGVDKTEGARSGDLDQIWQWKDLRPWAATIGDAQNQNHPGVVKHMPQIDPRIRQLGTPLHTDRYGTPMIGSVLRGYGNASAQTNFWRMAG